MTRCSKCGAEVQPDETGAERQPCPKCGSLRRTHEVSAAITGRATLTAKGSVERAVNEARVAAFFVFFTTVVGVGMTVGFAASLWLGVLAAVMTAAATALVIAAVYRVPGVRQVAMELMHRITGQ